jgi:hypothetical protein
MHYKHDIKKFENEKAIMNFYLSKLQLCLLQFYLDQASC